MSVINFCLSAILIIILFPIIVFLGILIKITSKGSPFFSQKRIGKNGVEFLLWKFRTMYVGAEKDRKKYLNLNESNGPTFKIRNDPRYIGIGRFLAHTGLDELPQLFNILKGEMSFVGPRPLPVYEAQKLKPWQKKREQVLPGITSFWVINGMHKLSFDKWMKLDLQYIREKNLFVDIQIILKTFLLMLKFILNTLKEIIFLKKD